MTEVWAPAAAKRIETSRIRDAIAYDAVSGRFTWKEAGRRRPFGGIAGGLTPMGYWTICLDGVQMFGHHVAFVIMTGDWPAQQVDHRDTNRSNNTWINLRPASTSQNNCNRSFCGNKSGRKGVYFDARWNRFYAAIREGGRYKHIGCFKTAEEAHAAYASAASDAYGEFARPH